MKLRSGKKIGSSINTDNQPFRMIIAKDKINNQIFSNNIDFDNAKKEWRKNKINLGNGMFKYKVN